MKNTCTITKHITLEKNGKTLDFIPGEVSADRISAIEVSLIELESVIQVRNLYHEPCMDAVICRKHIGA